MDVRAYIQSGILEQYVLGTLDQVEQREVEYYAGLYPSVKEELTHIEQALEDYAFLASKEPPPGTLDAILKKINSGGAGINTGSHPGNIPPATTIPTASRGGFNWQRFLAIGMTIKFLLTLGGLLYVFFQNQNLHDRLDEQRAQQVVALSECDSISNELATIKEELIFLKDLDTRPIVMNATPAAPAGTIAAVYFNPDSRRSYLGGFNLPLPPSGKQYQLWAIVDGKPMDMGVFDLPSHSDTFIEVPFISNAQAFAISLEDAGGKPQPTMDQIYVLGNV